MSIRGQKSVMIEFAGVTKMITAEFNYWPGTPDVMYMPNGDPGYPGDPPELELTGLFFGEGPERMNVIAHLSEEERTEIENAIIEEGVECDEDGGY